MAESRLLKELGSLEEDQIVLIVVKATDYLKVNLEILSYLVKKKSNECVYVTLNRPYENLVALFEKNGIDPKKFYFIDTISATTGAKTSERANVSFIASPHGLTEISISLNKAIDALKGENKFLFFDSISTLLVYNQAGTVTKFAHFLIGKMRTLRLKGIFISLEKETEEHLINQMCQFVDKVINLEELKQEAVEKGTGKRI
ncbi:MAG: ATPase domain-containing protein [Candidatus Diapherotrites archaeon]